MPPIEKLDPEARKQLHATLHQALFEDTTLHTYAVLDGASIEGLLEKLAQHRPEHVCLYRGELEAGLAEAAPYLVLLQPESEFVTWLIEEGWGNHWGIYALTPVELKEARKHFRTFLMVKGPSNESLYFRYYDPRVLILYLPTTLAEERDQIFGPICRYISEDGEGQATIFEVVNGQLSTRGFAAAVYPGSF